MNLRRICSIAVFVLPLTLSAASREMLELQRDVSQLQQDLKTLQRAFDEKIPSLVLLMQQTMELSRETNKALNSLEGRVHEQLSQQSKEVVAPVVGVGAKIDQLSGEFSTMRESVADTNSRLGKIEQQILDLGNAIRSMQSPAAPPPGAGSPPAAAGGAAPPPADTLYENARRDKSGGKADLAVQEFTEYLKYYPTGPYAPNAQYYIGEIHFAQGEYDSALHDFDLVLEKYPNNNKTPDAHYMKGQTLVKMGKRTAGAAEFRTLIRDYPRTDLATKALSQLKLLGLSATTSPARRR
jgi:tol-pal system protein YbgF